MTSTSRLEAAWQSVDRLHHATIHEISKEHDHLLAGIVLNVAQNILLVGVFYLTSMLFGFGSTLIRGDLLVYLITGVFLFNLHVKTAGAVLGAGAPEAALMAHGPVTPALAKAAAAAACLYTQIYSVAIVAGLYHALIEPLTIHQPFGAGAALLLSWFSGAGVGLLLSAVRMRSARLAAFLAQAYSRINMIASGQMFVANVLPVQVIAYFQWNPLFHIVDQARGFAFLNYTPWFSQLDYPVFAAAVLTLAGMLASSAGTDLRDRSQPGKS